MATSFHSKPISTLHLAWAAGFIEGEGSFSPGGPHQSSKVSAAQVQKEPIDRLHAMFGGRVTHRHTNGHTSQPNLGLVFDCPSIYRSYDDAVHFNVSAPKAANRNSSSCMEGAEAHP